MKKVLTIILIFFHTGLLAQSDSEMKANITESNVKGFIDFSQESPTLNKIECKYKGAGYDSYYKKHWLLHLVEGFFEFKFQGQHDFSYHVLGSTYQGISYCYINVYINGVLYESNKFIDKNWDWKIIPSDKFISGTNTVKLELTGKTNFWIDYVKLR